MKQVQQLKLNVTNINSFLKESNKKYIGLKKSNNALSDQEIKKSRIKEKESKVEKISPKTSPLSSVTEIASPSMGLFDKAINLGSILLTGVLINALPAIKEKVDKFKEENKEVINAVTDTLTDVKNFATSLFDSMTGPESEEGAFDSLGKFDPNTGEVTGGALKTVKDTFDGFAGMISDIEKALGGKGTIGNALKTDAPPPKPSPSGMMSEQDFYNTQVDAQDDSDAYDRLLGASTYEEYKKKFSENNTPVSPGGSFSEGALISALDAAGYTNKKERAMFLAQMAHESGNFRYDEEIWGPTSAQKGYEGRSDLGNNQPGDGYKYRGRGYIQLTGRANYRQYGKLLGVDLENNPDLAKDPNIAARVAIEYWKKRVNRTAAQKGDVKTVTYNINGGYNGLTDRIEKYKKYLKKSNTQPKIAPNTSSQDRQISALNTNIDGDGSTTVILARQLVSVQ